MAPDTFASLVGTRKRTATLEISGTDDRQDELAYAIQIDGEGWGDFFTETEITLDGLAIGEHTVEVASRDRWLNVDESPATVRFEIDGKGGVLPGACAGCSVSGRVGMGGWGLFALGLFAMRRRSSLEACRDESTDVIRCGDGRPGDGR